MQVEAHEESQKYKEGKFILERANVTDTPTPSMSLDSGHLEHSDDIDSHYF